MDPWILLTGNYCCWQVGEAKFCQKCKKKRCYLFCQHLAWALSPFASRESHISKGGCCAAQSQLLILSQILILADSQMRKSRNAPNEDLCWYFWKSESVLHPKYILLVLKVQSFRWREANIFIRLFCDTAGKSEDILFLEHDTSFIHNTVHLRPERDRK